MNVKSVTLCMVSMAFPALIYGQSGKDASNPLLRHYRDGETLSYRMVGTNDDWHYSLEAHGVVNKDAAGQPVEVFHWSNLQSNGQPEAISPASLALKQELSLDPSRNPTMPDLSKADTKLIGPITDLMTFYVDLWLAVKTGQLLRPGDHFYFPRGAPNSWADGSYVVLGEDAIDFDMTWKSTRESDHAAVILIRHVPPKSPQIKIPAAWMQPSPGSAAYNWVQVTKLPGGKYLAAAGKETFDVELQVSLVDGKILSGKLNNAVEAVQRDCTDQALTQCGEPKPISTLRKIEIALIP